jgi:mannose-6-phosphate isomerase-like protein (cupin superfamily)
VSQRLDAPFDLSETVVGLSRDGAACAIPQASGPPRRIDGLTIGAPRMSRPAPHNGEMHPDGDELLFVVSGAVEVVLLEPERVVRLAAGQALVVPKGVWHRVVPQEPSQLLHITPGPGGAWRPLPQGA